MNRNLDWFALYEQSMTPWKWSRKVRRKFLLTLPVSGPLYLLYFSASLVLLLMAIIVFCPIRALFDLWADL